LTGPECGVRNVKIPLGCSNRHLIYTKVFLRMKENEALINEPEGFVWVGRRGPVSDEKRSTHKRTQRVRVGGETGPESDERSFKV
jgi:hypothetical protein